MICLILLLIFLSGFAFGQQTDPEVQQNNNSDQNEYFKFRYKDLIIPVFLIGYGIIGVENDGLKLFNSEIKEEIREHIDEKLTIDDFSQYAAFTSVYALNAFGIKGKHNFRDRTIMLGTSYLLMGTTVLGLKETLSVERPDGSSNNSFPSGHTATAFMGAEFLYQETKHVSVWYGITGYLVAAGTGFSGCTTTDIGLQM